MRLVLIEWLDSYGCSSQWRDLNIVDVKPMVCRSVGWLLHDGKDCKVIVPHVSDQNIDHELGQGCGDMTIPTKAILSVINLSYKKRRLPLRSRR
jgi:hypothetical protein